MCSLATICSRGFSDGEVVEIIAAVALNIFTNYFNHIAGTEIDFPVVKATAALRAQGIKTSKGDRS